MAKGIVDGKFSRLSAGLDAGELVAVGNTLNQVSIRISVDEIVACRCPVLGADEFKDICSELTIAERILEQLFERLWHKLEWVLGLFEWAGGWGFCGLQRLRSTEKRVFQKFGKMRCKLNRKPCDDQNERQVWHESGGILHNLQQGFTPGLRNLIQVVTRISQGLVGSQGGLKRCSRSRVIELNPTRHALGDIGSGVGGLLVAKQRECKGEHVSFDTEFDGKG